jgi:peroxiredoxin
MSQIQARNAVVFGVSADTVESHKQFADKEMLNFPLLADPEHKMIEAYGALMPNGKMAQRYTFVIGPDGRIAGIDRNVNAQFERGMTLTSRHGLNLALLLSDWKAKLGSPVPTFSLADTSGKTVGVSAGKKATVVVFLSKSCPVSRAYDRRLVQLASDPAYKDVAFLGLAPNATETNEDLKAYAERAEYPFPVAKDPDSKYATHFGAKVTPSVWVLDAKGIVVYAGAIDDNQTVESVKKNYLKEALDEVLAGKPVTTAETKATGCDIKRAPARR